MSRIGHVNNRRSVEFRMASQRIYWFRNSVASAVVSNVGDSAIPLMVNGRLICRATLQIVKSHKAHVRGFRRITDFLRGRHDRPAKEQCEDTCGAAAEHKPFFFPRLVSESSLPPNQRYC